MTHTGSFYDYNPSTAAAWIFAILYIIVTGIACFQTVRNRSWIWTIMMIASIMEMIGYIGRIDSAKNVDSQGPYTLQFLLIILAPVVIAGAVYVLFGRIVFYVTPREKQTMKFLWMPPRFLTLIFVCCDILAFLMQGIGGIEVATGTSKSSATNGKNLALAGLGVQLAAFGFFSIIAIRFNIKSRNFTNTIEMTNRVSGSRKTAINPNWMGLLITLNVACGLILIRSIYRCVEFAEGNNGYVSTHEWCSYIFDALPIFPIFVLFIVLPPGNYVPYMGWRVPKHAPVARGVEFEQMA